MFSHPCDCTLQAFLKTHSWLPAKQLSCKRVVSQETVDLAFSRADSLLFAFNGDLTSYQSRNQTRRPLAKPGSHVHRLKPRGRMTTHETSKCRDSIAATKHLSVSTWDPMFAIARRVMLFLRCLIRCVGIVRRH